MTNNTMIKGTKRQEEFEDIKGVLVIRICKLKKNRQHNYTITKRKRATIDLQNTT
jgi:predicted glycosyltransferase